MTTSRASPGSPNSAKPGALRRGDARAALPSPPRPPPARTNVSPGVIKSMITFPFASVTTVPRGTSTMTSSASAPLRFDPCPGLPCVARRCGCRCRSSNVVTEESTTAITSPPRPPLPPSGPPKGLNFSRWIDEHPLPPLPPCAWITARSTKVLIEELPVHGTGATRCAS